MKRSCGVKCETFQAVTRFVSKATYDRIFNSLFSHFILQLALLPLYYFQLNIFSHGISLRLFFLFSVIPVFFCYIFCSSFFLHFSFIFFVPLPLGVCPVSSMFPDLTPNTRRLRIPEMKRECFKY